MPIRIENIVAIRVTSNHAFIKEKPMTSQPTMEIREIRLSELHPASYNPRKKLKKGDKEYEKIKQSLLKFGYVDPIIVNKDLTVIGGHQRLTVLKDLDYETAKCVIVDLSKEDEKALNIALNKITGQWDDQLLADLLLDLQEADFNLDLTGFEPPEIDDILSNVHDKDLSDDDFDVEEELKKPTFSKQGDIWQLGKHRVICGDSTKAEIYDQLLGDKKANLVVTDPPYNVDVEETAGKILNDNMPDSEFYQFLFDMFTQVEKHIESDASIYVFHADTEGLNFRKAFKDAGFYLSGCCIWKKNSLVLGRSPYQWQHEPCLFGWKQKGKHQWFSDRKQTTIWEYDRPKSSKDHPTMKPIPLMAYPIQNSSMRGTIVLDPFLGSGSTLIAADQTGRVCYGIELDEKFVDVIVKRYIESTGNDNVTVLRDGQTLTFDEAYSMMEETV
ncbi:hypothetical protein [Streptococcus phage phi-SsUD.1]|nr:hypothetical protein [Streptococcus phage phi-SsUD.1]